MSQEIIVLHLSVIFFIVMAPLNLHLAEHVSRMKLVPGQCLEQPSQSVWIVDRALRNLQMVKYVPITAQ